MSSELLAISSDCPISPKISFKKKSTLPDELKKDFVWGIAWYPVDYNAATVVKESNLENTDALTELLQDNNSFYSTVFTGHFYASEQEKMVQDIQPFSRPYAGKDWILVHNGDFKDGYRDQLSLLHSAFEAVGSTDSEHVLCWLLTKLQLHKARTLSDVEYSLLHTWIKKLNELGQCNLVFSGGDSMVVYQDVNDYNPIYCCKFYPPNSYAYLDLNKTHIEIGEGDDHLRSYIVFSHSPVGGYVWKKLWPGQMLVVSHGKIVWDSSLEENEFIDSNMAINTQQQNNYKAGIDIGRARQINLSTKNEDGYILSRSSKNKPEQRLLKIVHETKYSYEKTITLSKHSFRLQPIFDRKQEVLDYHLFVSAGCRHETFEDVFGNTVTYVEIVEPYDELIVRMEAKVSLPKHPNKKQSLIRRRTSIPLTWMPSQRQMMQAFLLPFELPESQLIELMDYAMSFVARNDYDVIAVLNDINRTIFKEYQYKSGSTTFSTTAFDVYCSRKGVCQDFSNLFICLARLLGVPARYRSGYIFNGGQYENSEMSDATHAWVEIYLPWIGWHGYDPTNGCLAMSDHVRVACGRSYLDATPTSGTIYQGGGTEKLSINVKVFDVT